MIIDKELIVRILALTLTFIIVYCINACASERNIKNISNSMDSSSMYSEEMDSDNTIRLHVYANSDSRNDQEIKNKLCSKIYSYLNNALQDEKGYELKKRYIEKRKNEISREIKKIAQEENLDVTTKFVYKEYPLKKVDNMIANQGVYYAVEVSIGAGRGHNFWQAIYDKEEIAKEAFVDDGKEEITIRFKLLDIILSYIE